VKRLFPQPVKPSIYLAERSHGFEAAAPPD
jgi:hypothetical protein